MQVLERLSSPDQPQYQTISFTYWLQWHLSKQLKSASEFARQHQIALKGDLPIGPHLPIIILRLMSALCNAKQAGLTHKPQAGPFSAISRSSPLGPICAGPALALLQS